MLSRCRSCSTSGARWKGRSRRGCSTPASTWTAAPGRRTRPPRNASPWTATSSPSSTSAWTAARSRSPTASSATPRPPGTPPPSPGSCPFLSYYVRYKEINAAAAAKYVHGFFFVVCVSSLFAYSLWSVHDRASVFPRDGIIFVSRRGRGGRLFISAIYQFRVAMAEVVLWRCDDDGGKFPLGMIPTGNDYVPNENPGWQ